MGRMLEAFKHGEERPRISEPVHSANGPELEMDEPEEVEEVGVPFIEVGGPRQQAAPAARVEIAAPRKACESMPRLEVPGPRPATLQVRQPQGIALINVAEAAPAPQRIAADLVTFHKPQHPVSKQYSELFGQLSLDANEDGAPVILITALAPGAGTTTAVLNLAITGCLQHGKRIIVVDSNHTRAAAASRLAVVGRVGIHDVLGGQLALEQAIKATPIKGLSVLPAGKAPEGGRTNVDALRWVLQWLRQRFELVIVDAPAWDELGDLRALLSVVNGVYLVVDASETDKPEVRSVTREAARGGSRLGGLIVTR